MLAVNAVSLHWMATVKGTRQTKDLQHDAKTKTHPGNFTHIIGDKRNYDKKHYRNTDRQGNRMVRQLLEEGKRHQANVLRQLDKPENEHNGAMQLLRRHGTERQPNSPGGILR